MQYALRAHRSTAKYTYFTVRGLYIVISVSLQPMSQTDLLNFDTVGLWQLVVLVKKHPHPSINNQSSSRINQSSSRIIRVSASVASTVTGPYTAEVTWYHKCSPDTSAATV